LAEANKILANDESVKWSSKPTDPIKQGLKKIKKSAATSRGGPGPFQGPSSYPQLVVADFQKFPRMRNFLGNTWKVSGGEQTPFPAGMASFDCELLVDRNYLTVS
jgi:hypothetical protein